MSDQPTDRVADLEAKVLNGMDECVSSEPCGRCRVCDGEAALSELAALASKAEEAERDVQYEQGLTDKLNERLEAAEREAETLRAALTEIVNCLGPDYFGGELEGLLAEGGHALDVARRALAAAGGGDECSACDGHGFMAGAHTERVEPCPHCGGMSAKP